VRGDGRRQRDPADLAQASSAAARVLLAAARCSRPVSPKSIRCCGRTGKTMPSDLIRRQAVVLRKDHAYSKNVKRDRGSIENDRGFSAIRKMKTSLSESFSAETVMVGF
jgi:hypothetical protein